MQDAKSRYSPFSSRSREGFTLLEVLIAVAIFSVVIAALYSTFFLSHKAVEAVDDSLQRLQESRAVLDVIKRELESVFYSSGKKYTVFKLDDRDFYGKQASGIAFTCFSPLVNGLAGVSYEVGESDGRLSLKKKIASAFSKSTEAEAVELIEDVESFTIEVKFNDKWVKTWDSSLANSPIPEEIRISLTIRSGVRNAEEEKSSQSTLTVSDVARPKIGRVI